MLISYLPVHHRRTVWQSQRWRTLTNLVSEDSCSLSRRAARSAPRGLCLLTKHSWCDSTQMLPAHLMPLLSSKALIKALSFCRLVKVDHRICSDRLSVIYLWCNKLPIPCYTITPFSKLSCSCIVISSILLADYQSRGALLSSDNLMSSSIMDVDWLQDLTKHHYSASIPPSTPRTDIKDLASRHNRPQTSIRTKRREGQHNVWQLELLNLIKCVTGFCLFMAWTEWKGQAVSPGSAAWKFTSFISHWEQRGTYIFSKCEHLAMEL